MNKNSKNVNTLLPNEAIKKETRKVYQVPKIDNLGNMKKMTLTNKTNSSIDNLTQGVLI
jgi:hypothetical protein